MDSRTVGILGGGQLGRMLVLAGHRMGIRVSVLDPGGSSCPAGQLSHLTVEGSFQDSDRIKELSSISEVLTTEIEHVDTGMLEILEDTGYIVNPNAKTLKLIQDKLVQKQLLKTLQIPQAAFVETPTVEAAEKAARSFGYPFMLKCRKLAYDGRGNVVVKSSNDIPEAFSKLGGDDLYAEQLVSFAKELAVMVVRTKDGLLSYPVVETVQVDNVCRLVVAPAQVSPSVAASALAVATKAVSAFDGIGIYGVELFLMDDDTVLFNEVAPRPHNSGHYTIEACEVDQFEMHLRAILGLACPAPALKVPFAAMINVLGPATGSMVEVKATLAASASVPGARAHWYGKSECRAGRKMAHITITADSVESLRERLELCGVPPSLHGLPAPAPRVGIVMGSDSDLAVMRDAANVLQDFGIRYELTIVSAHRTPTRMYSYAQSAIERGLEVIVAGAGGAAHLPGMVAALTTLPVIGVPMRTEAFGGNDSLLSIVQMPKGVPVATVAINNATNAGLLAVRILASRDPKLALKLEEYSTRQEELVLGQAVRLEAQGHDQYLRQKQNQK